MASLPRVDAVHLSSSHTFSKQQVPEILLVAGLGVEGDAHQGAQVKHRSRVRADPTQPNLRQVHLIHGELHDGLNQQGFNVEAGQMGENITTRGLDIHALPTGTVLRIGETALVALTGLRNPCGQLNGLREGLQGAVLSRDEEGALLRRGGVMGVVVLGGAVRSGDAIEVAEPPGPKIALERV